jgi:hypothetical protein
VQVLPSLSLKSLSFFSLFFLTSSFFVKMDKVQCQENNKEDVITEAVIKMISFFLSLR